MKRPHGTGSVYQDKGGRWVASLEDGWTTSGRRKRRRRIASSEVKARQLLVAMMREASSGPAAPATVKSYSDEWLERIAAEIRPATFSAHRSAIRLWIVPTIGRVRLDQLKPANVRSLDAATRAAGKSPSTTLRVRAVLASMLKAAIVDGHAVPAAVREMDRPRQGEGREAVPAEAVEAILRAAATRASFARWILALRYGVRPAEALGLTWDNITPTTITIQWQLKPLPYRIPHDRSSGFRVPAGHVSRQLKGAMHLVRPKTRSGWRVLPVTPELAQALAAWREVCPHPYGLVFSDGTHAADKEDRAVWRTLCAEAGVLGDYALYSARHSAATNAREAGLDDQAITALMGHASILSTMPYLHPSLERAAGALAKTHAKLVHTYL